MAYPKGMEKVESLHVEPTCEEKKAATEKTVTIKSGDLFHAAMESMSTGKLANIASQSPSIALLIPVIAIELEERLGIGLESED